MRSMRAISWIWKRIVSVFSNVIVRRSPSWTRRRFFIATMWRRNSSRSRSYSRRSLMSSSVSFCIVTPEAKPAAPGSGAAGARPVVSGADSGRVGVDLLEALREATRVALLRAGEGLEPLADLVEALVTGGAGEARVHLRVLVRLALDRRLEVVGRRTHLDTRHRVTDLGEEVEVPEGVAGLTLRHRAEERSDVRVALDVRLLGEVEVAPVRLALPGEGLLQVVVGRGVLQVRHHAPLCVQDRF